jgi:ABC-type glycerol-3-phosphate transport system substrate-binding protein
VLEKNTDIEFILFSRPLKSVPRQDNDFFHMLLTRPSPDLIVFSNRYFSLLLESGFLAPLDNELLLEIDSDEISEIRAISTDLQLYILPFGRNVPALFYNKNSYNQMQVEFPVDGMSWGEIVDLAKKIRNPGDWTALNPGNGDLIASQIHLRIYDSATHV